MKILLTGGAGYIGSHTAKYLSKKGITPIVFDNLSRGNDESVKWGSLIIGDVRDANHLTRIMLTYRPDVVIHFAALAYVGESSEIPEEYYHTNVVGTLNLVQAMKAAGCSKLVFSSSCAIFKPDRNVVDEESAKGPMSPYGRSKLMAEEIIKDSGIRHVNLRYFNAAGADPEGELGENHVPETHLIPLAIMAAQGQIPFLSVNGQDYETADGTCIRDYVHVWDLAQAHYLAVKYLLEYGESESFNLGSGTGHSIIQVIMAVHAASGLKVPYQPGKRRLGDPSTVIASSDKARQVLGWRPDFTNLTDIVRTAWDWHQKKVAA